MTQDRLVVQRIQSGNIRSYAGWLAIGAAALLLLCIWFWSAPQF